MVVAALNPTRIGRYHPRPPHLYRRGRPRGHPSPRVGPRRSDRAARTPPLLLGLDPRIVWARNTRFLVGRGLSAYIAENRGIRCRTRGDPIISTGSVAMIQFHSLEIPQLERFLERHRSGLPFQGEIDLDLILRQILHKANEFVPSQSGSILLHDPFRKLASRHENELVFIATFGEAGRDLVGHRLSAKQGIAGQVYQTGTPRLSADVEGDVFFYPEIDQKLGHKTHSVVCVPIYIGKHVCGVLELINRLDGRVFTDRDNTLLEVFAGYTSFTLQNALHGKRAHDLARKDDRHGLLNDRWFHMRLTDAVAEARQSGQTALLIFMDLDQFKQGNYQHAHLAGTDVLREGGSLVRRIVQ